MGKSKDELMRLEVLRQTATQLLLRKGAVSECKDHEGYLVDNSDDEAVKFSYAAAANLVNVKKVDATHKEMARAVRDALDEAGCSCAECDRIDEG